MRIIASPGDVTVLVCWCNKVKRAAELRLITCCYLGASRYVGFVVIMDDVRCSEKRKLTLSNLLVVMKNGGSGGW